MMIKCDINIHYNFKYCNFNRLKIVLYFIFIGIEFKTF